MKEQPIEGFLPGRSVFETELSVRPDDLDFFQHVHASKYQDYVLAARFDQMERCYGISMEAFMEKGLGWYVRDFQIEYKRSLGLGDRFRVRTWIHDFFRTGVRVRFEILRLPDEKLACRGESRYTLISLQTSRPQVIPDWVMDKYAV